MIFTFFLIVRQNITKKMLYQYGLESTFLLVLGILLHILKIIRRVYRTTGDFSVSPVLPLNGAIVGEWICNILINKG